MSQSRWYQEQVRQVQLVALVRPEAFRQQVGPEPDSLERRRREEVHLPVAAVLVVRDAAAVVEQTQPRRSC